MVCEGVKRDWQSLIPAQQIKQEAGSLICSICTTLLSTATALDCLQLACHYLTVQAALHFLLVCGMCNLSQLKLTIRLQVQHGSLLTDTCGCLLHATAECMPEHDMCVACWCWYLQCVGRSTHGGGSLSHVHA